MPYTNAFIQEMLRFRTLVPLNVAHEANQDTEIDGYIFPKNTLVIYDNIEKLCPMHCYYSIIFLDPPQYLGRP